MRVQRTALRALCALPDAWAARLAGEPTRVRGRALDPRFALLARAAARRPPLASLSPVEARAATDTTFAITGGRRLPLERIAEHRFPGPAGLLRARLHTPAGLDGPRPLLLYFHQGGGVLGSPEWCEPFCRVLAREARCPVLAIDYRKAPEHRFPAAAEDAWAAYAWARECAGEVGGDPARVGVGGDSVGGGLAAGVVQRAAAEGVAPPLFQLLVYPWLEGGAEDDAWRDFGAFPPLTRDSLDWFLAHYAGPDADGDARLAPGLAPEVPGATPALVYTAGFDPLCDQGERYARRLERAGAEVTLRCYDALPHSFTGLAGASPAAAGALVEIARDVDRLVSRRIA